MVLNPTERLPVDSYGTPFEKEMAKQLGDLVRAYKATFDVWSNSSLDVALYDSMNLRLKAFTEMKAEALPAFAPDLILRFFISHSEVTQICLLDEVAASKSDGGREKRVAIETHAATVNTLVEAFVVTSR